MKQQREENDTVNASQLADTALQTIAPRSCIGCWKRTEIYYSQCCVGVSITHLENTRNENFFRLKTKNLILLGKIFVVVILASLDPKIVQMWHHSNAKIDDDDDKEEGKTKQFFEILDKISTKKIKTVTEYHFTWWGCTILVSAVNKRNPIIFRNKKLNWKSI